jgi:hypothetical protein
LVGRERRKRVAERDCLEVCLELSGRVHGVKKGIDANTAALGDLLHEPLGELWGARHAALH